MPGAGKTTLATRLSADLRLPLLTKDDIKVTLGEVMPPASLEDSMLLGRAAIQILYRMSRAVLEGDSGLVLESAFIKELSEAELQPLLALADVRHIRCQCSLDVAKARYRSRERHPVHRDGERPDRLVNQERYHLDLDIPTLDVQTQDGYQPGYDAIKSFAEAR